MSLSEHQLLKVLIALAVLVVVSRGFGELARRARLPEVVGQLLAGVVLGPSLLGLAAPGAESWLFSDPGVGNSLSAFSWVGAVLLLLLGGLEVDLAVIRAKARVGILAAAGAILPSIAVGIGFGTLALGQSLASATFLGVVLSVTAVTVTTAFLLEQGLGRRDYAQVILVSGVISELVVWLLVPVVSALYGPAGAPLPAGIDAALSIVGVFLLLMTFGRRITFWIMRRCADTLRIRRAPISLVLVLTLAASALTQALGLHPLLGAFIVGLLLVGAPRVNPPLIQSVRTMTLGFFAPIFFTLAGMRVDVTGLGGPAAIVAVVGLFAAMGLVKFAFTAAGARLGGLRGRPVALVGLGSNFRGGTDVIVASVGTTLGFLSTRVYTLYALGALLTLVVFTPLLSALARATSPTEAELRRLAREELQRGGYVPTLERIVVPLLEGLPSPLAAVVVERLSIARRAQRLVLDVIEVEVHDAASPQFPSALAAGTQAVTAPPANARLDLTGLLAAAARSDLVVAVAPDAREHSSFRSGSFHHRLVTEVSSDVLLMVADHAEASWDAIRRILVPCDGLAPSTAASDLAVALAPAPDTELVIFHAVRPPGPGESVRDDARQAGTDLASAIATRLSNAGVRATHRVAAATTPSAAILAELESAAYGLVVLGGVRRGGARSLGLGPNVHNVLAGSRTPAAVLVVNQPPPRS